MLILTSGAMDKFEEIDSRKDKKQTKENPNKNFFSNFQMEFNLNKNNASIKIYFVEFYSFAELTTPKYNNKSSACSCGLSK